MNISEIFSTPAIAANWEEAASNREPYFGEILWPSQKKMGIDLKWIKGYNGLPVSLAPSTLDSKSTFIDRIGVSEIQTEMAFFRSSMLLKEKDLQEIDRITSTNDPYAQQSIANMFNDGRRLINSALVVPERMRMQLLSSEGSPKIAISANGVNYEYNYDPDGEFARNNYLALSGTDVWSNTANSNPLKDLETAINAVEVRTGVRPTIALMNKKTFNYLLQNERIRSAILAQNPTANIFLTEPLLKQFISALLGVTVYVYSKQYDKGDKTSAEFYPDGFCALLPDAQLGSTWFGCTPEERSARMGGAQVSLVETGIALSVYTEGVAPIQTITTASEIVLPSFERMDETFVMKVC